MVEKELNQRKATISKNMSIESVGFFCPGGIAGTGLCRPRRVQIFNTEEFRQSTKAGTWTEGKKRGGTTEKESSWG